MGILNHLLLWSLGIGWAANIFGGRATGLSLEERGNEGKEKLLRCGFRYYYASEVGGHNLQFLVGGGKEVITLTSTLGHLL